MKLQNLFSQMSVDPIIIEQYKRVTEKEKTDKHGNYATHDLSHVKRVIANCEKISRLLRCFLFLRKFYVGFALRMQGRLFSYNYFSVGQALLNKKETL